MLNCYHDLDKYCFVHKIQSYRDRMLICQQFTVSWLKMNVHTSISCNYMYLEVSCQFHWLLPFSFNSQEAVGDTLEELWISYNQIEKLKGINVLKKMKVGSGCRLCIARQIIFCDRIVIFKVMPEFLFTFSFIHVFMYSI